MPALAAGPASSTDITKTPRVSRLLPDDPMPMPSVGRSSFDRRADVHVEYSESGSTPNTVVRFDPKTAKFQSWTIPGGGNIVRNTSVTPDGNFLLANSLVNSVTLVTIRK